MFAVLASQRMTTEKALQQYTNELLKDVVDETLARTQPVTCARLRTASC